MLKRMIASLVAAFAFASILAAPAMAKGQPVDAGGMFLAVCGPTQVKQVDPIVERGVFPSMHMHTFYGHYGVDQNTTISGLTSGGTTACHLSDDSSAYWAPTAYRTDTGQQVVPKNAFAYYLGTVGENVRSIPAGLEMVGGDKNATGPNQIGSELITRFACNNGIYKALPYDCRPYGSSAFVEAIVVFPYCWDGTGLTPDDVKYGDKDGTCPAMYPIKLAQLRLNQKFKGFQRGDLLSFSSGDGYTLHADFMNGWKQNKMDSLTAGCLDVGKELPGCIDLTDAKPGP
jgi:Domain of unknown function (DUF1996)